MASTSQPINVSVSNSATDLYTAFVAGGASRAQLISLNFCNTTVSDITMDCWHEVSGGGTKHYLIKSFVIPAQTPVPWTGMAVINNSGDKWRAQGSATGVDCVGAVVENA